jgi:hypothetical protein
MRTLERALAAGDEQVRLPLASAYQRVGRAAEALELLNAWTDPQALALETELWRSELSRLRPAARIPGARPYGAVCAWSGARPVLLESTLERGVSPCLLGVADFEHRTLLWERSVAQRGLRRRPIGASLDALWTSGEAAGTLVRHPLHDPSAHLTLDLDTEGQVVEVDPKGQWALLSVTSPGGREVRAYHLESGGLGRVGAGSRRLSWAVDWEGRRLAWLRDDRLCVGDLEGSGELTHLSRARLAPGTQLEAVLQGEALLMNPLQAVPLSGAQPRSLASLRGHGPWRRTRDGRFFLGYRMGLPVAIASHGVGTRTPTPSPPRGMSRAHWHPHTPVVAMGRADEGTELRDLDGSLLSHLPRDSRPLGWRPDGRGLVVVRRLGPTSGLLELWTPEGRE